MFVDIHSHIIPEIDDGAKDLGTAAEMLRIAVANGTAHIVATPHFISKTILNSSDIVDEKCHKLCELVSKEAIKINIYPGSEVFISPDIPELYDNKVIATINNSSYILVELPMMNLPLYTDDVLFSLQTRGLIPIIAHPERNELILSNHEVLSKLIKRGIIAHVNSGSITGIYGKRIQKAALEFIKMGMVQFVASDAHTCRGRSPKLTKAAAIVKREFGGDVVESLFYQNGLTVLNNGVVPPNIKIKTRSGLFSRISRRLHTSGQD